MRWHKIVFFVLGIPALALFGGDAQHGGFAQETESLFFAVPYQGTVSQATWGIQERDGANRPTRPYLSSLVGGESGTGKISSPPFRLEESEIVFTIRGHDGRGGGRNENYIALVDAKTGNVLHQSPPPGQDALVEVTWDVERWVGRPVRVEMIDGNRDTAFAWFGIERLDAGENMNVDFTKGLPGSWKTVRSEKDVATTDHLDGPVPFRKYGRLFTLIPESGGTRLPVGTKVRTLYFRGLTIPVTRPLADGGRIELVYADQSKDQVPLLYGFTLEGDTKLPGTYPELFVRPVGDGTEYLLAITPRSKPLAAIVLRPSRAGMRPRISAITCEIAPGPEVPDQLEKLPTTKMTEADRRWIASHTLSAGNWAESLDREAILRALHVPVTLEERLAMESPMPLRFRKQKIADTPFEAACVTDVDQDGVKDIVSGENWWKGPDFKIVHKRVMLMPSGDYFDDFSDYPMDVNGDGFPDIVSGGWFGKTLRWEENPRGRPEPWKIHEIDQPGPIETTRFWDVDGDGHVEAVPNAGGNVVVYRLVRDEDGRGTGEFEKHMLQKGGVGHGIGFGDVNGDGRKDFVIPTGWLEAPENPYEDPWVLHKEFSIDRASDPMLVHDVNQDGKADLIVGQAHGYGLNWYEQQQDSEGKRTWKVHPIDPASSQYHDLALADLDRDGELELVTGKRYYAHSGHDPGAEDPVFVRYFDIKDGTFVPHTIDYGPAEEASGVGIYFWLDDIDGNGWLDIVAPGKEGLYVFWNEGKAR